jgi:hypothetical protein
MVAYYGSGMHDFILRELEVGTRVAMAEDDEACGFGPLFDLMVSLDPAMVPPDHPRG